MHGIYAAASCVFAAALSSILALARAQAAEITPEVFAPGIVSGPNHEAAPAFTPDGSTLYFQRSTPRGGIILVTQRRGNGWSKPKIAPFSGVWSDIEPAMAPDGSFLIFVSNRPATAEGEALQGFYNGSLQDGGNMWRVDRRGDSWSEPIHLPETVNRSANVFAPSIASDGSLYFMDTFGEKRRFRLYYSQYREGSYQAAQALPFSDGTYTDVDPAVASNGSFLIFGSGRPPAKSVDLFIVRQTNGVWGEPIHLGDTINTPGSDAEPRLSPDQQTLYFSSERTTLVTYPRTLSQAAKDLERMHVWDNGQYHIWRAPLGPLLESAAIRQ